MKNNNNFIAFSLAVLSFLGTCFIYNSLPETIPVHFDYCWQPDGYAGKKLVFLLAGSPLFFYFLLQWLTKIEPRKNNYEKHKKPYELVIMVTQLLLIAMNWLTIGVSLGMQLNIRMIFPIIFGIVFIVLGNYMPKLKSNYFVGIKTPWALENDEVWRKTNRFGGYLFIILGVLFCVGGFVQTKWYNLFTMTFLLAGLIACFIYSYYVYKKVKS